MASSVHARLACWCISTVTFWPAFDEISLVLQNVAMSPTGRGEKRRGEKRRGEKRRIELTYP
jgi:hypothetical protein